MSTGSSAITVAGPKGGLAERRCVRVKQDKARQTQCPGGSSDIMRLLMQSVGLAFSTGPERSPDGVFRVPILSQDDGQGHRISISRGTLGEPVEQAKRFAEAVFTSPSDWAEAGGEYRLDLTGKLEWSPDDVVSAAWVGTVRSSAGTNLPSSPPLRISGFDLLSSLPVYAQITVSYTATVTESQIAVVPHDDGENNYQSTVVIASECGGLERLKIEVPQCFEDFWLKYRDIIKAGGVISDDEDEDVAGADPYLEWDLCGNHKLKSDSLGLYDHIQGDVCYPGVPCSGLQSDCLQEGEEE